MKPYLFLDVDGVLNARVFPYQEHLLVVDTAAVPKNAFTQTFSAATVELRVDIPNAYSAWLAELAGVYQLVWATTWEHLANVHLAPLLELDPLPVVELSALAPTYREVKRDATGAWKWRNLAAFAGAHPFAFVDDHAADEARDHPLTPGRSQGVLAVTYGLERAHVDALLAFAAGLAGCSLPG